MSTPVYGPAQPSHEEIMANLKAMLPKREGDTPRHLETFEQIARRMLSWQRPENTRLARTAGGAE